MSFPGPEYTAISLQTNAQASRETDRGQTPPQTLGPIATEIGYQAFPVEVRMGYLIR